MVVTGMASLGEAASIARASPPAVCRLRGRGSRTACTGVWPLAAVSLMHVACPQTPGSLPDTGLLAEEGSPLPRPSCTPILSLGLLMLPLAFSCEDSSPCEVWVEME